MNVKKAKDNTGDGRRKYVIFKLGNEYYGINILSVREIIQLKKLTHLPGTGDFVEGIINIRGEIVPVLNLSQKFGLEETADLDKRRIITVLINGNLVGLIVDRVDEVLTIEVDRLSRLPGKIGMDKVEFIENIALQDDRMIILIDVDKILSADEQDMLQEIVEESRKSD